MENIKFLTFKKIFLFLLGISCVIGLSYGYLKLQNPAVWPIKTIKITGTYKHLHQDDIKHVLLAYLPANFITLDSTAIKKQLSFIPWVARVEVQRKWPNALQVIIEEHEAAALWNRQQLLDINGELFNAPISIAEKSRLPLLEGEVQDHVMMWPYYQQIQRLFSAQGLQIARLHLSKRHAWCLQLTNGLKVYLGRNDPMSQIQKFLNTYAKLVSGHEQQIAYVDLRYSSGMSVLWKDKQPAKTPP